METQILTQDLFKQYNSFIAEQSNSMFYHTIKYKNFLEKLLSCESHYLLALDKGIIHGALPLMIKKGKYGRVVNSLPYYGSNGGIITDNQASLHALKQAYNNLLDNDNIAAATLVTNPFFDVDYTGLKFDLIDKRIGQWINLKKDQDTPLFSQFDSSARRNVKKAINSGITVDIDNDAIDFLQTTHIDNMKVIGGMAKTNDFFSLLRNEFEPGRDYKIFVAIENNTYIAALLAFYYKGFIEYFTPVIKDEYRDKQPLALIIHEATQDAIKNNFKLWNWGGTWLSQNNVYKFKSKWGSEDKEYTYYIKINNKEIYTANSNDLLHQYPNFFVLPFSLLGE